MANVNFDHLFSPLQVGPMKVPNRICETTNTINSSMAPGLIDENFIAHHGAKAKGGTGWIGSETWLLNSPFPPVTPPEIGLAVGFGTPFASYQNPAFLEGKKKFCEEIHKHGAVVVVQLTHLNAVWAPSAVPVIGAQDYTPHVLGEAEIQAHLDIVADAAEAAMNCGADGVELHCAHETLGYAFLSPVTNHRSDEWGGGPENRIRFVVEALKRIRARVGSKLAVGIRMAGMEFREGGYDNLQMREMLYLIGETGLLDFVDIDVGHCWGAPSYVPNSYYGHGQFRDVGKGARVDLDPKIKVLFTGRINDPVVAEDLLKNGYCDLVGMVRAGIADPEFAIKAKEGRLDEIRRCIACTRCIDEASEPATFPYTPMCSINPVIGSELRWEEQFKPAAKKKNVVVVGGGLAGCEAARIAAKRGHNVTLLDKNKRLGGQLLISSKVAGRDSFEDQIYFEENEMIRSGVTVKLETSVDLAAIKALKPDAVVIATGSTPRVPHDVEGLAQAHVVQGWDVMQGKAQTGQRVAVISQEDYYETPCVAEFLAAQGKEVTVFHKSVHLGSEIARYSIGMVHKRMEEFNVTVKTNLVLKKVEGKNLELASAWGGKTYHEEGFDSVVLVYASTPQSELYDQLKADGSVQELYIAGAAWLPRHMAESTRHGANIGLTI